MKIDLRSILIGFLATIAIFAMGGGGHQVQSGPVIGYDIAHVYNGQTPLTIVRTGGVDSSNGATTLVALTANKSIYVLYFSVRTAGAVNWNLQSHTTTSNTTGTGYETTYGGQAGQFCPVGIFATTSGEALDLNLSAGSVNTGWTLVYTVF